MKLNKEYWIGFFRKIIDINIRPVAFFEQIKEEHSIWEVIVFFTILQAIVLPAYVLAFNLLDYIMPTLLILWYFETVFLVLLFFIAISLAYHLFILLFGGRKGVKRTIQAFLYGMIPSMILGWVPFLGYASALYSVIIAIIGIKELHEVKLHKAILAYLTPMILILIFGVFGFLRSIS